MALAIAVALSSSACSRDRSGAAQTGAPNFAPADGTLAALSFVDANVATTLSLKELLARIPAETVRTWDPLYGKEKHFRALPLARVLAVGFPRASSSLASKQFVVRAADGYATYLPGELATTEGAYLAVEDLDVPTWETVGTAHVNPGPFYLAWSRPEQTDPTNYPRPWQVTKFEVVDFDVAYPHLKPANLPANDPAMVGYGLFRERCFKCHAMNQEGGHVGPDLNVPQNVLEYRPEAQVRAYIRNPVAFRYSHMPPNPDLTETQLDSLLAYLRAMKDHKHDPTN